MRVVCGALLRAGKLLATRRGPAMRHPGRWELPGGKIEPGETEESALERELAEELGLSVCVRERLAVAETPLAEGRTLTLVAYRVESSDTPELREHDALTWLDEEGLDTLTWADGDVPLLPALRQLLTAHARG
jgi:8-oxo-dGTP diphosphatase